MSKPPTPAGQTLDNFPRRQRGLIKAVSTKANTKAVRDTLAYYEKRTGIDSIKSIEGKIVKVQRDIDEMRTAFIEAKNALLRANIEKRMNDYQILIEDLQSQKAQL